MAFAFLDQNEWNLINKNKQNPMKPEYRKIETNMSMLDSKFFFF